MNELIERRMQEGLAQLNQIKILLSWARKIEDPYRIRIESDSIKFWEGYLTALETLKEDLE